MIKGEDVKIQKDLNCANWKEVSQRVKFQDEITKHLGYLSIKERNKLWNRFKAGQVIRFRRKQIKL